MNYFTADLHFGHKSIIKYEGRPFSNVKEMDEKLIENWNNRVKDRDKIFILGDFTLSLNEKYITSILEQLKGKKILIQGNHDYFADKTKFKKYFELITPYYKFHDSQKRRMILCHYPIYSWDGMRYGTYHLYGHVHSKDTLIRPNAFNVGVDVRNYQPVTLEELLESQ